ncbi:MAG: Hpt domain-containing protein [Lachnospiraceae bacterium]|jgi:histidine phosphotransfer protein HptB|nr:Hpt domain-containing protein [Lachnospiraceae bacterium]MCI1726865.1 Hpt domain-containing protein [Lachnospiraceae bacterium]
MTELLDRLQDWGCNIPEGMNRFLQDKDLYVKCLKSFVTDESFARLSDDLKNREFKGAFEDAHTLKGVSANLSLTPMYEAICRVVEDLRNGPTENLDEDVKEFEKTHQKYLSIMEDAG